MIQNLNIGYNIEHLIITLRHFDRKIHCHFVHQDTEHQITQTDTRVKVVNNNNKQNF